MSACARPHFFERAGVFVLSMPVFFLILKAFIFSVLASGVADFKKSDFPTDIRLSLVGFYFVP